MDINSYVKDQNFCRVLEEILIAAKPVSSDEPCVYSDSVGSAVTKNDAKMVVLLVIFDTTVRPQVVQHAVRMGKDALKALMVLRLDPNDKQFQPALLETAFDQAGRKIAEILLTFGAQLDEGENADSFHEM